MVDDSTTSSELLQRHLPTSHLLNAFNNINFVHLAELARPAGSAVRSTLAIAGDDPARGIMPPCSPTTADELQHALDAFGE